MATTEPVQSAVENEEKPESKTTPIKDNIKENGQEPPTVTATPEEQEEHKEESSTEVKDTDQPEEEEVKGQDEADRPDKEAQQNEENEDGSEEEESSDGEPQVGSLDGPVKLMTGKRERKKVERLTMQSPKEKEKEKFEIKEGRGIKLGDCPIIEFNLQRTNADVLKPLYRVLFYKTGKTSEIKKNIRKFSGFPFTKDDKTEVQRKEKQLDRFTTTGLKELCSFLALERKGTKEDLMNRIMDYCLEPVMITKKPPVKRKKGTKKSGKKRKHSGKGDASNKKDTKSSEQAEDDEDDDEDEAADEEEEEEEESAQEEEDSDYEEPKKKKARKSTPKSAKKTKAKTPAKAAAKTPAKTPKKSPTKKSASKAKAPVSDDSSDDEAPLSKKSNSPPSESEIRSVITKFLDGANLEQVTMKTVCKMVYDKYPEFDLTPKKDFIKSTVKEIISS